MLSLSRTLKQIIMRKSIGLSLLALTILSVSCVSKKKYVELENNYNDTRSELQKTQVEKQEIEAKYAAIEDRVASYNAKISSLTETNDARLQKLLFCLKMTKKR